MKVVIYKLSGKLIKDSDALNKTLRAIQMRSERGQHYPVIVHGGGPYVDTWCDAWGYQVEKYQGLRVSPDVQIPVITGALAGYAHMRVIGVAKDVKIAAIGMTPTTGESLVCELHPDSDKLGSVGVVRPGNTRLLISLLQQGYWPIFHSMCHTINGQCLNVNADDIAAALCVALQAEEMVFFSDVPGVLDTHQQTIPHIALSELEQLQLTGHVHSGMLVKIKSLINLNWESLQRVLITNGHQTEKTTIGASDFEGTSITELSEGAS